VFFFLCTAFGRARRSQRRTCWQQRRSKRTCRARERAVDVPPHPITVSLSRRRAASCRPVRVAISPLGAVRQPSAIPDSPPRLPNNSTPCESGTAFLRWRWEPQATLEAVAIGEGRRTRLSASLLKELSGGVAHIIPFHPWARLSATKRFPAHICLYGPTDDREAHFVLRQRSYEDAGIGLARGSERDEFDDFPSTVLIGAAIDGRLVGTLRLSLALGLAAPELPCEPHYPEVQEIKASSRGPAAEFSRGGIEPDIANTSFRTTMYASVIRAGLICCLARRVGTVLVATRPKLQPFYEYMLGLQPIARPALYPPGDEPVALLGGSFSEADSVRAKHNRFFDIGSDEVSETESALREIIPETP
jgi:hypothetical protein